MNILPEESCVTLRNSMVCSTSKNWKINSLSQSFLNLAPQYPDSDFMSEIRGYLHLSFNEENHKFKSRKSTKCCMQLMRYSLYL